MQLRKIFNLKFNFSNFNNFNSLSHLAKFQYASFGQLGLKSKFKYSNQTAQNLFKDKSFADIVNILKNKQNPYPKNSTYYNSILQFISLQCDKNQKLVFQQQGMITYFLNQLLERIKVMETRQVISTLKILINRSRYFRIQKNLLIALHIKFQIRFKDLIKTNEEIDVKEGEVLTLQDVNFILVGLLGIKNNTTILQKILKFSTKLYRKITSQNKVNFSTQATTKTTNTTPNITNQNNQTQIKFRSLAEKQYLSIFQTLNRHIDDSIDSMREAIYQFIKEQFSKGTLEYQPQILKLIVQSKFYKNYPIVSSPNWVNKYIKEYLSKTLQQNKKIKQKNQPKIVQLQLQLVLAFQYTISYLSHIQPHLRQDYFPLLQKAQNQIIDNILSLEIKNNKIKNKNYLMYTSTENVLIISNFIKCLPTYVYFIRYYKTKVGVLEGEKQNYANNNGNLNANNFNVNNEYVQQILRRIIPIFQRVHFLIPNLLNQLIQTPNLNLNSAVNRKQLIKNQNKNQNNNSLQLLCVQNILETMISLIHMLKDFNLAHVNVKFAIQLISVELKCFQALLKLQIDQIKYLRLLQHSVLMVLQIQQVILLNQKQILLNQKQKVQQTNKSNKDLLRHILQKLDTSDTNYKVFSVIRINSIARCLNIKLKHLQQKNKYIKLKKTNTYIQTLSRTMLKKYNEQQITNVCEFVSHQSIPLKDIQLGRLVLFSCKEKSLVRFWMYLHRAKFVSKVALNQRILTSISSIVKMDNLEINRNNIQILAEFCILNKLKQFGTQDIQEVIQQQAQPDQKKKGSLKSIISSSFSVLIRNSLLDNLIDQIFTVKKNGVMSFQDKFSHIGYVKILCLASYISENQAIFYLNKQNKNKLFKFVNLLIKKSVIALKQPENKIFRQCYNDQSLMLITIQNIVQKYLPQNKYMNSAMPFYCQFMRYYIKINKTNQFFLNKNFVFLFVRQLIDQFKLIQRKSPYKMIFSHIQSNLQRLCIVQIFQREMLTKDTIREVMLSMNYKIDQNIFTKFKVLIMRQIKKEVQSEGEGECEGKFVSEGGIKYNKVQMLANRLITQRFQTIQSFKEYSDAQILTVLTQGIFLYYKTEYVDHNLGLILKRSITTHPSQFIQFSLFKKIVSNLLVLARKRNEDSSLGSLPLDQGVSYDLLKKWIATQIVKYSKSISNISQIKEIICILNELNLDILSLQVKFGLNFSFTQLLSSQFDVESISLLFYQNILFLKKNSINSTNSVSKEAFLAYIKNSFKVYHENYIVNYYSVYFPRQGSYILNMFKSIFLALADHYHFTNNKEGLEEIVILLSQLNDEIKKFKEISQLTIMDSDKKQKKQKGTSLQKEYKIQKDLGKKEKYSYKKNPFLGSIFNTSLTNVLEKLILVNPKTLGKQGELFTLEDLSAIKNINKQIFQRQKQLATQCELNYFTGNQTLQIHQFQNGLKLYSTIREEEGLKPVLYYIVSKQSTLWSFENDSKNKKQNGNEKDSQFRINGHQQMIILYIQKLIKFQTASKISNQNQLQNSEGYLDKLQLKIIQNGNSKIQYEAIFITKEKP